MATTTEKLSVLCLSILLVSLTALSIPHNEKEDLEYYFYAPLGQKTSQDIYVRTKRDADDASPAAAVAASTEKVKPSEAQGNSSSPNLASSKTTTVSATTTSTTTTTAKVMPDKSRGQLPPEDETTILKEIHEAVDKQIINKEFDVDDAKINKTINDFLNGHNNITLKNDHHKYYKSQEHDFNAAWIDLDEFNQTYPGSVKKHGMLSKSYRRAATISLKFEFPFYGHPVKNITIATGGFLYTGEYVHSWLAATQYIAPLMANFDTSQMDTAVVRYGDNSTTLVVEWANVSLQTRDNSQKMEGPFTFQAILRKNGDILFAYKHIPVSIKLIKDEEHPVKVGLSDAYIIERTIFFVRRKTIYEYHRVDMKDKDIKSFTAIILRALPRCNMMKNCKECLAMSDTREDNGQEITCKWCGKANLCSDGYDRNKQGWLQNNCDKKRHQLEGEPAICDTQKQTTTFYDNSYKVDDHLPNHMSNFDGHDGHDEESDHFKDSKSNVHHTGVALLTIVIILILTICGWCLYAYFFPHTCSGQLLIKYRPSRWHWRRGEPRYTAASIHM